MMDLLPLVSTDDKPLKIYGVLIDLGIIEAGMAKISFLPSTQKIDVCIKYQSKTREFTYHEFLKLLGFEV